MKYLLPAYWQNFKNDGKLFEQLSKVLIEYEYNQKDFFVVGGPGDGGKDIYKEIPLLEGFKAHIWAQCKYYQRTLSFNDISYTLLMAYLKNTEQILIFSYSKGSTAFIEALNEYRNRTGKMVILYMDISLENLILKHRNRLIKEHKEFFPSFPSILNYDTDWFSSDYQIYIDGIRIENKKTIINLNTICELVITITNQTFDTKDFKIECLKNRVSKSFLFLDEKIEKFSTLQPQHSEIYKFHVKLKENLESTSLPAFLLSFNNISKKLQINKELSCRWLADVTLIGNQYYTALQQINTGIKYSHFHLSYIYGKSGVGKSRILSETKEQCIRSDKKYIYIDSEKKELSCKTFVEILCSNMTVLPLFNEKIIVISDSNDITMEYATKILYDKSYDVVTELDETCKFFARLMTNQKFVLVFDNIQHFDKTSLCLIDKLIKILKNTKNESNILLGINTDYIYQGSYFNEFFHNLKFSCGNSPEYYLEIALTGFELCDSELYIRECLSYQSVRQQMLQINYDQAVRKIALHCENNPFYIQQFLLYLEQKNILKRSKYTLYYFYDVEKFIQSFQEIPQSIESLIAERERLFLDKKNENLKEKYKNLIYLINITNYLPLQLYYEIINDNDFLNNMFNLGFITIIDEAIVPIHSYFTLFYNSNYMIEGTPPSLLELFVKAVDKLNYHFDLALPYLWASYTLGKLNFSIIQNAIEKINSWNFDCSAFLYCLKSISNAMDKYYHELSTNTYINVYRNITKRIEESLGIDKSLYFYNRFLEDFLKNPDKYKNYIKIALPLIVDYLIHLVNKEDYEICIAASEKILETLKYFCDSDCLKIRYEINRCKIMIHNRKDEINEAIGLANDNLDILNKKLLDSNFKVHYHYSAYRSIGNTYFYSSIAYQNKNIIIESWNRSFNDYINDNDSDITTGFSIQPKIAAFAKGLAADIISGNEVAANQKAAFFKNAFDKMNMIYYEMQIRLLIAIYLTWKWSDKIFGNSQLVEINQYIDQTIDIAAVYGRQLTTINAFHLRAVMYFLAENYDFSLDNYHITTELLTKYLKTEKDYERWSYFWIDYARVMRKNKKFDDLISYCSQSTKLLIKNIYDMSDTEFIEFELNYIPLTAITDKNHIINFPKI